MIFFLLSVSMHSYAIKVPKQCLGLADESEQHYHALKTACIDFFSEPGHSGYTVFVINKSDHLAQDINKILRNFFYQRLVIFFTDPYYVLEDTVQPVGVAIGLVGVKNNKGDKPVIVLETKHAEDKHDTVMSFVLLNNQLFIKDIKLTDVNPHVADPTPAVIEESKPVYDRLIEVANAGQAVLDGVEIDISYHKNAIYFRCPLVGNPMTINFRLINSTIKIPSANAHAIGFYCDIAGFNYNAQIAFSTFALNEPLNETSSHIEPFTPSFGLNTTANTTASAYNQPLTSSMIYIDIKQKERVRFTNSPCNRLKYFDQDFNEHEVPLEQALVTKNTDSFQGGFAITERDSPIGTYFTQEGNGGIIKETFQLQEFCPVELDKCNVEKLSNYLPRKAPTQTPSPDKAEIDWKSEYEQQKKLTKWTSVGMIFFAVTTVLTLGAIWRNQNKVGYIPIAP